MENNPQGCICLLTSNPTSSGTVVAQRRRGSIQHSKYFYLVPPSHWKIFKSPKTTKMHTNKWKLFLCRCAHLVIFNNDKIILCELPEMLSMNAYISLWKLCSFCFSTVETIQKVRGFRQYLLNDLGARDYANQWFIFVTRRCRVLCYRRDYRIQCFVFFF